MPDDFDPFIRVRRESRRRINDADVDKMTLAALERVDEARTLREINALRVLMKAESRRDARVADEPTG